MKDKNKSRDLKVLWNPESNIFESINHQDVDSVRFFKFGFSGNVYFCETGKRHFRFSPMHANIKLESF